MSGHSKWSSIKRQKGMADTKRSATFTKLANTITIAAREGGGDQETNFRLRLSVEKARAANMPKENIERAIKRGTGELGGAVFEQMLYEAYGPHGVAILIDVATDNRNRTVASIQSVLNKFGAKLAESGAVRYLFDSKGVMTVAGSDPETTEGVILESSADDYAQNEDGSYTVFTSPHATATVAKQLASADLTVSEIEFTLEPRAMVLVPSEASARVVTLLEQLEALDDVVAVSTNFQSAQ